MALPQLTNLFKVSISSCFVQSHRAERSQYTYTIECLFTITITLVKLSILAFYRQIFETRQFRITSNIIGALCVVWFFVCFFVSIFQCSPVHAAWDVGLVLQGKATCIVYGDYIIGYELSNMLLDIAIIVSCLWMIKGLQLSPIKKIIISSIFFVGSL